MRVDAVVNRQSSKLILWCLLSMILLGCTPKSEEELYGIYEVDYKLAKEKLILYKNGNFLQIVTRKDTARIDTSSGTWSYEINNGWGEICFNENFMSVLDAFGKLNRDYMKPRGYIYFGVADFLGEVKIEFREGVYYKKVGEINK